jgi:hypothetical protein
MIAVDQEAAVIYPISTLMSRANTKMKLMDRNIPMTSDVWGGGMSYLVNRYRKINNWQRDGVQQVKVFFEPAYYMQNRSFPEALDPLHLRFAIRYAGIKV